MHVFLVHILETLVVFSKLAISVLVRCLAPHRLGLSTEDYIVTVPFTVVAEVAKSDEPERFDALWTEGPLHKFVETPRNHLVDFTQGSFWLSIAARLFGSRTKAFANGAQEQGL